MKKRLFFLFSLLALLTAPSVFAAPSSITDKFQIRFGGEFGFGGRADTTVRSNGMRNKGHNDLNASLGFRIQAEYPLHEYFGIGLLGAFRWVNLEGFEDQNIGRSTVISLNVAPRGRYPFLNGDLELYVLLPIGVDLFIPSNDFDGPNVTSETGADFSIGFFPGIQYFFTENIGAYFEIGLRSNHWSFSQRGGGARSEFSTTGAQFHLSFGVAAAF